MKLAITLTILSLAIAFGIPLPVPNSNSMAAAPRVATADTGVIALGPGQKLRITASPAGGNYTFAFRRVYYTNIGPDIHGVWKYMLTAQDTTAPITPAENEAVWIDIDRNGFDAVRGEVIIRGYTGTTTVNSGITVQLINANGEVQSVLIALLLP